MVEDLTHEVFHCLLAQQRVLRALLLRAVAILLELLELEFLPAFEFGPPLLSPLLLTLLSRGDLGRGQAHQRVRRLRRPTHRAHHASVGTHLRENYVQVLHVCLGTNSTMLITAYSAYIYNYLRLKRKILL